MSILLHSIEAMKPFHKGITWPRLLRHKTICLPPLTFYQASLIFHTIGYSRYEGYYPMETREAIIFELQDQLDDRGLNFAAFSRRYGFDLSTVHKTIHTYYGTGQTPRGPKGRKILRKLAEVLAAEPELVASQN